MSQSIVTSLEYFVVLLKSLNIQNSNKPVCFDVVGLFINIPIDKVT
jgi:hypothetical protein